MRNLPGRQAKGGGLLGWVAAILIVVVGGWLAIQLPDLLETGENQPALEIAPTLRKGDLRLPALMNDIHSGPVGSDWKALESIPLMGGRSLELVFATTEADRTVRPSELITLEEATPGPHRLEVRSAVVGGLGIQWDATLVAPSRGYWTLQNLFAGDTGWGIGQGLEGLEEGAGLRTKGEVPVLHGPEVVLVADYQAAEVRMLKVPLDGTPGGVDGVQLLGVYSGARPHGARTYADGENLIHAFAVDNRPKSSLVVFGLAPEYNRISGLSVTTKSGVQQALTRLNLDGIERSSGLAVFEIDLPKEELVSGELQLPGRLVRIAAKSRLPKAEGVEGGNLFDVPIPEVRIREVSELLTVVGRVTQLHPPKAEGADTRLEKTFTNVTAMELLEAYRETRPAVFGIDEAANQITIREVDTRNFWQKLLDKLPWRPWES